MKKLIIILLLFSSCEAQKVEYVYDGDCFIMSNGDQIRLAEIDAPEISQLYGIESRTHLLNLIEGKKLKVIWTGKIHGKRKICKVYANGVYVSRQMVIDGYAWAYRYFSMDLVDEEDSARSKKLGLWKYPAQDPYYYRKSRQ